MYLAFLLVIVSWLFNRLNSLQNTLSIPMKCSRDSTCHYLLDYCPNIVHLTLCQFFYYITKLPYSCFYRTLIRLNLHLNFLDCNKIKYTIHFQDYSFQDKIILFFLLMVKVLKLFMFSSASLFGLFGSIQR